MERLAVVLGGQAKQVATGLERQFHEVDSFAVRQIVEYLHFKLAGTVTISDVADIEHDIMLIFERLDCGIN